MGNVLEKKHDNLRKLETSSRPLSENKESTITQIIFKMGVLYFTF